MITKSFDGAAHHHSENDERSAEGHCPACSFWGCSPACVLSPYPREVEDAIFEALVASFDASTEADMLIGNTIWCAVDESGLGESVTIVVSPEQPLWTLS